MTPREPSDRDDRSRALFWLLTACRRPEAPRPQPSRDPRELGVESLQRDVLRRAIDHRVVGLTVDYLHGLDVPGIAELGDARRRMRLRAAVLENRLDLAVRALVDVDAGPVLLKGATVAGRFYRSPELRDQVDIDILVDPDRVQAALGAMESLGYRFPGDAARLDGFLRYHFHVPLRHPDGHMIEIHWELQRPDARFRLEADGLRARARSSGPVSGVGARHPRSEDVVLHLVLQNLQEGFSRLSRIVDVDRIVSAETGFDWPLLVETARDGGMATPTAVTLQLARQLMGAPVPDEIVRALRPTAITRGHISAMKPTPSLISQRFLETFAARQLLELWLTKGVVVRMRSVWGLLAEDPEDEILWERRVDPWTRWIRLAKLGILQVAYYGNALGSILAPRRRAQMRFWSSHAINSDFL